ncbi:hypothetical protein RBA69_04780 [Brenneria goodwinii]|uniref:hypothetical protein n=1 Tax=Brenneria goodwinii TaxID=1109412 RepID=UPI0036E643F0
MDIYKEWRELKSTDAHALYEKINAVNVMSYVNCENYKDLVKIIDDYKDIDNFLYYIENRGEFKPVFLSFTKLFFNFISSSISLRDSSRNLIKLDGISTKEICNESTLRLRNNIINNPLVKFVEDFRNIISHQQMILPIFSCVIKKEKQIAGFSFKLSELMEMQRFSEQSKVFLKKEIEKYIFADEIVKEYFMLVSNYQKWLLSSIYTEHYKKYSHYWSVRGEVMFEWDGDMPINDFKI